MTKSIIITKHGGPEVLELKDVKVGPPGPEEIKIKNSAIGINFIDTYHRSGLYKLKLPTGIGMEGAGVVEEIGSKVKIFNKGDRVAYSQMPSRFILRREKYSRRNCCKRFRTVLMKK